MKTEMYCYLENREKKPLPSRMDEWLDPTAPRSFASTCTEAISAPSRTSRARRLARAPSSARTTNFTKHVAMWAYR